MLPLSLPFMVPEAESGAHPARHEFAAGRQIYISTCGFWTAKGNYDSIYAFLARNAGKECAGIEGKISEETAQLLAEPLFPKDVFEKMADGSWKIGEGQSNG